MVRTQHSPVQTSDQLWYGYLDESGDTALFSGSQYLIVAVLLTTSPRALELHIKRARSTLGRRARTDEFKATAVETAITRRLLHAITDEDIEISAVVIEKRAILRPPSEPEDIYRYAVTQAVNLCVDRHPRLEMWLDKRYTKPALRDLLEKSIREGLVDRPKQMVLLHQVDSQQHGCLQVVDHVAWAFHHKYERNDDSLYQVFSRKVVAEEVVTRHLW